MAKIKPLQIIFLVSFFILGGCLGGTETGNPQAPTAPGTPATPQEEEQTYTNDDFHVSAEYDSGWDVTENPAAESPSNACSSCDGTTAADAPAREIDTSNSPSTEFTDETTVVTIYYVTLNPTPASLEIYLETLFSSRIFESFSSSQISGFKYDNSEAGETGGDRREYYFLNGNSLLYVVTDLYEANGGIEKFEAFINSLRFE